MMVQRRCQRHYRLALTAPRVPTAKPDATPFRLILLPRTVQDMHFDELSLAASIIRDARVGNGETALGLATDLLLRLGAPVGDPLNGDAATTDDLDDPC